MELSHLSALFVFFAVLLLLAAFATRLLGRVGVPSLLFFLLLGVVTRTLPWHMVAVPRPQAAFQIGTLALIFILFDGCGGGVRRAAGRQFAPEGARWPDARAGECAQRSGQNHRH